MNILHTSETCEVMHAGPLLVTTLTGTLGPEVMDHLERGQQTLLRTHPKIWVMAVMNAGFGGMKPGVREKASEVATRSRGNVHATVLIINGRGLMAVIARTALATFSMIDRSGTHLKVFKHVGEGLEFLSAAMAPHGHVLTDAEVLAISNRVQGTTAVAS